MGLSRRFRLLVDDEVVGRFRSDADAVAVFNERYPHWSTYRRWVVQKKVGGRWFTGSFGYSCVGSTSTADLAAMGVPINAQCLGDEPLT